MEEEIMLRNLASVNRTPKRIHRTPASVFKHSAVLLFIAIIWVPLLAEGNDTQVWDKMLRKNNTLAKIHNVNLVANNTGGLSSSSSVAATTDSASRSVAEARKQRQLNKLPIETLFRADSTKTVKDKEPILPKENEEKLRQALLNHSLHINDMDKDLDHLVFSQLPEGSKLILRTVKIVRTDGDGNEEDSGEESTSWDVVVSNGTNDDSGSDEDAEETTEISDLLGAASHARSEYKNQGSSHKTKEKDTKYYREQDHGKNHKLTLTDTEGTKKKKYEGDEKGVTDFVKSHGNAQNNEGGRYKDSKKKNKGRKVSGFKRVYHKEEFQRTEHFYDDEEAKRIAESFGQNDAKEKSSHGLKDDDRKYHGTYKEKTDGQKVKNEHQTKNGYNKGIHEAHKHSERHNHGKKYANEQSQSHGAPSHGGQYHNRPKYHENHNYHGAYSTNTKVTSPVAASESVGSPLTATTSPVHLQSLLPTNVHSDPDPGPRHRHRSPKRQPTYAASTVPKPSIAMTAPQSSSTKPKEMKLFFSPRERHFAYSPSDATMAYAPNFIPGHKSQPKNPHATHSFNFRTVYPLKPLHGSMLRNESYGLNSPRYAGNYDKGDPVPPYSTLPNLIKSLPKGNLLSIDKATGMEVSSSSEQEQPPEQAVVSTTEKLKHPMSGRPQMGWMPLGSNKYPISDSRPKGNNYPQFTHLRVGKTLVPTMLIRNPSTSPPVINNPRRPVYVPSGQPSTLSYNTHGGPNHMKRNPQFSHFMNGLMDSVAGFFGRIG